MSKDMEVQSKEESSLIKRSVSRNFNNQKVNLGEIVWAVSQYGAFVLPIIIDEENDEVTNLLTGEVLPTDDGEHYEELSEDIAKKLGRTQLKYGFGVRKAIAYAERFNSAGVGAYYGKKIEARRRRGLPVSPKLKKLANPIPHSVYEVVLYNSDILLAEKLKRVPRGVTTGADKFRILFQQLMGNYSSETLKATLKNKQVSIAQLAKLSRQLEQHISDEVRKDPRYMC